MANEHVSEHDVQEQINNADAKLAEAAKLGEKADEKFIDFAKEYNVEPTDDYGR